MLRHITAMLFLLALDTPAFADEHDKRIVSAVDMVEITRLSSARLSPDGRYLLYRRSRTDWDENRIVQRFQLLDLETGETLPAPNPADETVSARSAWWAPDGKSILVLMRSDSDAPVQVHAYDIASRQIEPLTNHETSINDLFWGAQDDNFYFVAEAPEDELSRHQIDHGWRITPYDTPANHQVWRFDMTSKSAEPVLYGDYSIRNADASPSGQALLFSRLPDHKLNSGHLGEVYVHNIATGESDQWTNNSYQESRPQLSPDETRLAYIATVNEQGAPYYEDKIFIQDKHEAPQRLLGNMAMEALDFAWDQTGGGLFIHGNTGLSADLYHYTIATGTLRQITSGAHNVAEWAYDPETNIHIARIEDADSPGELFVMRDETEGFEQVTHQHDPWTRQFHLPRQEAVSWRSRRGATIEGLLVYPIGYEEGKRYPLVTITHGGPRNSSRHGSWNVSRYVPVLAGQGYMVLLPNHRGGTGYGDRFMRDMYGSYFRNAHHDVMAGIDTMIERGLADPDRLIKMGWSAGGHMVNKLITQTDRFKAASSGAGAADWLSMHGESDVRRSRSFMFGGSPWERRAPRRQYEKDSPLADAWKVTTPTLFFVGENDVRVPPTQSILMHRGVETAGAPTVLYQAEGEPHNYRKPSHQLFKINTELAWFARHALNEVYEPVLPEQAFTLDAPEDHDTASDTAQ